MQGLIRYGRPDLSVGPEERSLYSFPAMTQVKEELQELHDLRTSPDIVQGPAGLDIQGFTYLHRPSSLTSEELLSGSNVEDTYIKEVTDLICELTGANRAVVDGVAFRQKPSGPETHDAYHYVKAGSDFDKAMLKMPRDVVRVPGRDMSSTAEPARLVHNDYTVKGLKDMVRWGRQDIRKVAGSVLEVEDAAANGEQVEAPRYAAYSVWRPLEPVKRDPLAVLDWRSLDEGDLAHWSSRVLSGVTENGETVREGSLLMPPADPKAHKWYVVPDMTPEEVMVIKFADTKAEVKNLAGMGCHGSPVVAGSESCPTRRSVECRVFAFWE